MSSLSEDPMKIGHRCLAVFLAVLPITLSAQCVNTISPSCGVYDSCFEKFCGCSSSVDEYFTSFGKKFCEAFLTEGEFSEEGKRWRDSTLRCLQEIIVPIIPIDNPGSCNCSEIKKFALSSHVPCYTKSGASICDLPLSDISKIVQAIVFNRAFLKLLKDRAEAYNEVRGVFENCGNNAEREKTRSKWKLLLKLIKGKVTNQSLSPPIIDLSAAKIDPNAAKIQPFGQ